MKRDVTIYPPSQTMAVVQQKIDAISAANQAGSKDTSRAGRERKLVQDQRQNLLKDVRRKLVRASTPQNSIFISYSGVGRGLGDMACRLAGEYGLFPKTGFDAEVELKASGQSDIEESLPQAIMAHIISCDCFLGVWTEDFTAESKEGVDMRGNRIDRQSGYVPSVWMPFELGVAASNNIPFRLLVVSGTHRLYYEKPFQFQSQIVFERHLHEEKVRRVLEYLSNKIRYRKSGFVGR